MSQHHLKVQAETLQGGEIPSPSRDDYSVMGRKSHRFCHPSEELSYTGRAARGKAALGALTELPEQCSSRRTCTLLTNSLPRSSMWKMQQS